MPDRYHRRMDAATALKTARSRQHWSQRALGRHSRTQQPSLARIESRSEDPTVERLNAILAGADAPVTLLPTRTPTVADWSSDLADLAAHDPAGIPKALVVLSDGLRRADPALRVALCVTPPVPTGVAYVDALVVALVEWTLQNDGLPVPGWVNEPSLSRRLICGIWFLTRASEAHSGHEPPEAFARRNVFLTPEFFASV